jgi:hypothetical protein
LADTAEAVTPRPDSVPPAVRAAVRFLNEAAILLFAMPRARLPVTSRAK